MHTDEAKLITTPQTDCCSIVFILHARMVLIYRAWVGCGVFLHCLLGMEARELKVGRERSLRELLLVQTFL